MGMLYERLFTGLSSIHNAEDEAMHRRLVLLQDISQNDLGKVLGEISLKFRV